MGRQRPPSGRFESRLAWSIVSSLLMAALVVARLVHVQVVQAGPLREAALLVEQRPEQMLYVHLLVTVARRQSLGLSNRLLGLLRELVDIHGFGPPSLKESRPSDPTAFEDDSRI